MLLVFLVLVAVRGLFSRTLDAKLGFLAVVSRP